MKWFYSVSLMVVVLVELTVGGPYKRYDHDHSSEEDSDEHYGHYDHNYHGHHGHHHHHYDDDKFGQDDDQFGFGQSGQEQFGQGQGGFGLGQEQDQTGQGQSGQGQGQFQQGENQFGLDQGQLGQGQGQLEQSQGQLGQSQNPIGQSQGQLGQNQGQLEQGQGQLGQSQGPNQFPGQGTTQSTTLRDCIRTCPVTSEFNPVCGTDNITYTNPGRLECAQSCGVDVTLLRRSSCNVPAPAPSAPLPLGNAGSVLEDIFSVTKPVEGSDSSSAIASSGGRNVNVDSTTLQSPFDSKSPVDSDNSVKSVPLDVNAGSTEVPINSGTSSEGNTYSVTETNLDEIFTNNS